MSCSTCLPAAAPCCPLAPAHPSLTGWGAGCSPHLHRNQETHQRSETWSLKPCDSSLLNMGKGVEDSEESGKVPRSPCYVTLQVTNSREPVAPSTTRYRPLPSTAHGEPSPLSDPTHSKNPNYGDWTQTQSLLLHCYCWSLGNNNLPPSAAISVCSRRTLPRGQNPKIEKLSAGGFSGQVTLLGPGCAGTSSEASRPFAAYSGLGFPHLAPTCLPLLSSFLGATCSWILA